MSGAMFMDEQLSARPRPVGGRSFGNWRTVLLAATFFVAFPFVSPVVADLVTVQSGHSALWYDPARDGEGWVLEILPDDRALLYWFTYDDEGNQRWLQAVGSITDGEEGPAIEFPELYVTRGAEFGSGFDPNNVEREVVGVAAMTFEECDNGTFSYTAFGQSQTIQVQRLTQTMAAGCQPINGVPGQPIKEYAGQSGSWFDTAHDGEGFALHWLSRDEAVVTWYTYDSEGNQYWMIGVGRYENGQIVFPEIQSTRGARFGEAFDPEDVERFGWGSLTMNLKCSSGSARYESNLAEFESGEFNLIRLTHLKQPGCPYVRPKLWDLYEIIWNEIPIEQGTPIEPNNIQADSIADDGTIAARFLKDYFGTVNLALWRPEADGWEFVPRRIADGHLFIAPNGDGVAATDRIVHQDKPIMPLLWTDGLGWKPLSGLVLDRSIVNGTSHDLSRVVGTGSEFDEEEISWIWDAQHGQQPLPETTTKTQTNPTWVSNDGRIVVGTELIPPEEGSSIPAIVAIRWDNGGTPTRIRDDSGVLLQIASACDKNCRLSFGSGQSEYNPDHPHLGQAWYSADSGAFAYFGALPDAIDLGTAVYVVTDVSADGSLVLGSYSTINDSVVGPDELTSRAYIWTQRTGMVSVRSLIEDLGIGDDKWRTMNGVSVSSNGEKILLSGFFPQLLEQDVARNRAVVLELIPRERSN